MKILLVDDNTDCLDDLAAALGPAGYQCETFTVSQKALEAYRQARHDVVITDMKMPGMNGLELLKEIRLINNEAKVIIVTGYGDVETAIAAVNNRAYAFFGKPIDLNDLMETLKKIENEFNDLAKAKSDYDQLVMEYRRLKETYEELKELVPDQRL